MEKQDEKGRIFRDIHDIPHSRYQREDTERLRLISRIRDIVLQRTSETSNQSSKRDRPEHTEKYEIQYLPCIKVAANWARNERNKQTGQQDAQMTGDDGFSPPKTEQLDLSPSKGKSHRRDKKEREQRESQKRRAQKRVGRSSPTVQNFWACGTSRPKLERTETQIIPPKKTIPINIKKRPSDNAYTPAEKEREKTTKKQKLKEIDNPAFRCDQFACALPFSTRRGMNKHIRNKRKTSTIKTNKNKI